MIMPRVFWVCASVGDTGRHKQWLAALELGIIIEVNVDSIGNGDGIGRRMLSKKQ